MCVTRLPGVEEGPRAWPKCEATNQTTSPKTSCSGKRAARHWQFQRADLILPSRQNPHAVKVDFASCSPQTSVELPRRPRVPRPPRGGGAHGLGHRGGEEGTAGLHRGHQGRKALWAGACTGPLEAPGPLHRRPHPAPLSLESGQTKDRREAWGPEELVIWPHLQ